MNISARRTGRTTRMLMDALEAARSGRRVTVVAYNSNQVHHLTGMLFNLASPQEVTTLHGETVVRNVSIVTWLRVNLDWQRMQPEHNPNPDELILVDHAAIETRYATMLEMLHRYDLADGATQRPQEIEPPSLPPVGERRLKLGRKT